MKQPEFIIDASESESRPGSGGLPDSPSFRRNHRPILEAVSPWLSDPDGDVVEIGSGYGQHAVAYAEAFPRLTWWPSDPSSAHLAMIAARRNAAALVNLMPPFVLDGQFGGEGRPPATGLAGMLGVNVLHIAPWPVTGALMRGAVRHLGEGNCLFVYGPFKRFGTHIAESNAAFDRSLRDRNPEWGVRDVGDVVAEAAAAGLELADTVAMPANNLVLVFRKPA
jgi:SAM-dependent methyltransferase